MLTLLLTAGGDGLAGSTAVPGAPPLARAELESFVDGFVADQLDEHEIPGAVFVLVRDGEIVLGKGYGHTDLERRRRVDPERSRFDIGSVTKLFTATAAMQLVEQGRLDLDADVNRYLSEVRVPATFPEPVTAAHLLTHTAGFAERALVGMVARTPAEVEPLGENLSRHLPPRIRPPGEVHQYSNQGLALAGLVVEELAGRPFTEVVEAGILEPLGMRRTTFGEPPALPAEDVVGHESLAGSTAAAEPWYVNIRPVGGLWSTGTDMAAFMLAHLGGGQHAGARILGAETVAEMQRTQFRSHPDVSGIGYGFFERLSPGRRAVQHGGGWIGFGSLLLLLPDENAGMFVSYNHGRGQQASVELADALLERFFPAPAYGTKPAAGAAGRAELFTGRYRWIRNDRHTFMRLYSALTTHTIEVGSEEDGTLTTAMSPSPLVRDARWIEDEPGVFREAGGTNTLAFDLDESGRPTRLHVAGAQLFVLDRLPGHEAPAVTIGVLLFFVVSLLVAAVGWPAGRVYRRLRRRRGGVPADLRRARLLGGLAGVLGLAFFVGLALFLALDLVGVLQISAAFRALLVVPFLVAALTVPLAAVVARLWLRREGSIAARVYHTGFVLTLVALVPFLYYWRLLGFHY